MRVIKFTQDPWGIKQQIKELWDNEGRKLEGESEKVEALISRNFITDRDENDNEGQEGE